MVKQVGMKTFREETDREAETTEMQKKRKKKSKSSKQDDGNLTSNPMHALAQSSDEEGDEDEEDLD